MLPFEMLSFEVLNVISAVVGFICLGLLTLYYFKNVRQEPQYGVKEVRKTTKDTTSVIIKGHAVKMPALLALAGLFCSLNSGGKISAAQVMKHQRVFNQAIVKILNGSAQGDK